MVRQMDHLQPGKLLPKTKGYRHSSQLHLSAALVRREANGRGRHPAYEPREIAEVQDLYGPAGTSGE